MEKAVIRERLERTNPRLSDGELEAAVDAEYQRLLPNDPKVRKFFEETAPVSVSPNRRGLFPAVEVKAVRQLSQMTKLEEFLRVCSQGRPTDRRLVVSSFERNVLENGRPELICHWRDFQVKNETLNWAYDWPARDGSNRDQSNVYRTLHSTFGRCDPGICLKLNVAALVELRKLLGDPDIGRYLVIDGTDIIAPREQRQFDRAHPAEEPHLRGSLKGADFASHGGRKFWRGYKLIYLTDVKTSLPVGFMLLSASRPEWEGLAELLTSIHEHWHSEAGEPWEPEYLIGDGHFDNEQVHRILEERFAIHPLFGRGTPVGKNHEWGDNEGTPYCAVHGDMKLDQAQYFVDHAKRRQLGLKPGEPANLSQAGFRWSCVDPACPVRATTNWDKNPRLYTFLPRKGVHHKRVALRKALMIRRNVSEALNARLKGRGIGNRGMNVPRWVSTDNEMAWLCYATSLAFTLIRLVHETGEYARAHEEAAARDLLTPSQPSLAPASAAASADATAA
jgi:Transposase DDE domain